MSRYMENLIFWVTDESESNSWNDAVLEWSIIPYLKGKLKFRNN